MITWTKFLKRSSHLAYLVAIRESKPAMKLGNSSVCMHRHYGALYTVSRFFIVIIIFSMVHVLVDLAFGGALSTQSS